MGKANERRPGPGDFERVPRNFGEHGRRADSAAAEAAGTASDEYSASDDAERTASDERSASDDAVRTVADEYSASDDAVRTASDERSAGRGGGRKAKTAQPERRADTGARARPGGARGDAAGGRTKLRPGRLAGGLNASFAAGGLLLILALAAVLLKPLIAGYGPQDVDIVGRLAPPGGSHALGTDNLGRDVLSRVLYGAQISLLIGCCTAIASSLLGLVIGLYAAMYRRLDQVLMRFMDAIYAFPAILLAIAIVAALGPSVRNLIFCLSFVFIPAVARIVRSAALVAREQTYVEAAKALGASNTRVIWRHILPAALAALIVQATFIFAEAIIVEAALSFLGAGIPAPTPSLGNLLSEGKQFIYNSWWMTVFPGLALIVLVLAVNLLGDGLRDLLDPQTRTARSGGVSGRLRLGAFGVRRGQRGRERENHARERGITVEKHSSGRV
ncbi:ABC transporter permease [Saccharibacillus sp. CPCC 101409]|uniref:ABC transporter permease n=1 Tax=Saccharibacillus sp. CPCC 101409 TaxID=3058041 RepID=UPI002672AE24|nr:ABC transporter permease [Saccharibacillus sp. CPCC 101409]MDO3408252.1 ABC transporter permease [Saccharibacillus sp. CPCC 101409]